MRDGQLFRGRLNRRVVGESKRMFRRLSQASVTEPASSGLGPVQGHRYSSNGQQLAEWRGGKGRLRRRMASQRVRHEYRAVMGHHGQVGGKCIRHTILDPWGRASREI